MERLHNTVQKFRGFQSLNSEVRMWVLVRISAQAVQSNGIFGFIRKGGSARSSQALSLSLYMYTQAGRMPRGFSERDGRVTFSTQYTVSNYCLCTWTLYSIYEYVHCTVDWTETIFLMVHFTERPMDKELFR